MDEREERLRRRLGPAGKFFLGRLDTALGEELDAVNNAGADAIRKEIGRHHMKTLDSVKAINRLAESGRQARATSYYMIMNYSVMLLESGTYHKHKGALNPTGEQLLQIWRIYANKLIDRGEATHAQIDAEEAGLMQSIQNAGRGSGNTLLGHIKSAFKKK